MKLRQFEETAFTDRPDVLGPWMTDISDASNDMFTPRQLREVIEAGTHGGFYYCTDDLDIMGIIVVTRILNARGQPVMVVVGAAGHSLGEWADANELLNELAQAMSCVGIEIKGRRGLIRAFKYMGWTEQYVSMYRPVEG